MEQPAAAVVPLEGRGGLPAARLHGRPLLGHVLDTLAGVEGLASVTVTVAAEEQPAPLLAALPVAGEVRAEDPDAWWEALDRTGPVLVVDPLCPRVPAALLARLRDQVARTGRAAAAYRPVTDTLKALAQGRVAGTLDREALVAVTSPVVLPAAVLGPPGPGRRPPTEDLAALVGWLRGRGGVDLVEAPPEARRVADVEGVRVLECLEDLAGHP